MAFGICSDCYWDLGEGGVHLVFIYVCFGEVDVEVEAGEDESNITEVRRFCAWDSFYPCMPPSGNTFFFVFYMTLSEFEIVPRKFVLVPRRTQL